jgi:purine nucleosidase
MRETIIIDTDPGQDDAVAILLALAAADRLDLRAITTVAGNVPVAQATSNALRIRELAERPQALVFQGCDRPLLYPLETAHYVCGPDGLDGADLPAPTGKPEAGHAVEFLVEQMRNASDGALTLCALGPLTNIALALRLVPETAPRIRRIVLMGGAMNLGNVTPAAEFNFHVDPHAAAIVFGSGIPIVMFGLHVTHQTVGSAEQLQRIADLGTRTGRTVHGMMTRPRPSRLGTSGHPLHDPCVIAYLLWPEIFGGRDCHVEIETGQGALRGRSTVDWHGRLKCTPNAHVADTVDAPAFFARLTAELARLP